MELANLQTTRSDIGRSFRAKPVLAFGRAPDRETSWIATVLEETGIGFISRERDQLMPLNDWAKSLRLQLVNPRLKVVGAAQSLIS